jgi:hypothetical protein
MLAVVIGLAEVVWGRRSSVTRSLKSMPLSLELLRDFRAAPFQIQRCNRVPLCH